MRYLILNLICISVLSCAASQVKPDTPPLKVSLLPKDSSIDVVLPALAIEPVKDNEKAPRFNPMLFSAPGKCMKKDSTGALLSTICKSGFLVDEHTFMQQNIADQSKLKQLISTQDAARKYFKIQNDFIRQAEVLYQQRVVELQNDLQKAQTKTWFERNKVAIGFVGGVVLTSTLVFTLDHVILK